MIENDEDFVRREQAGEGVECIPSETHECPEEVPVATYVAAGAVVVTVLGSGIGALLYFRNAAPHVDVPA